MYNMFISNNYSEQYRIAIANKFTHYGFTTIQNDFESIINTNINTNIPVNNSPYINNTSNVKQIIPNVAPNNARVTSVPFGGKRSKKTNKKRKNKRSKVKNNTKTKTKKVHNKHRYM